MRFFKNLLSVVALVILGYSHVIVLDEFALEEERIRKKTPIAPSVARLYVSRQMVASWVEVGPEHEPIENGLYTAYRAGERKFVWVRANEYVDPESTDEYATHTEISYEEGKNLLRDREDRLCYQAGPEYPE